LYIIPYTVSYQNPNKLRLIIRIQNITLEHTRRGVTQKWVYENHIAPVYFISLTTYYRYLSFNAKAALRELDNVKQV